MSESPGSSRSIVDHVQDRQSKRDRQRTKEVVEETIERCGRALTRDRVDHYLYVARQCQEVLWPVLSGPHCPITLQSEVGHRDDWHHVQVSSLDDTKPHFEDQMRDRFENRGSGLEWLVYGGGAPFGLPGPAERIERVYHSMVVLAEWRGYIKSEYSDVADVLGHDLQLGIIREPWERDSPDEIHIVDPTGHPPVSVNQGLPGFGKTTAGTTETEDRYAAGRKVVDVVDLSELENGLYDVPQGQDDLRDVREDMDLAVDFLDHDDYPRPEVEVLAPLTPGLDQADIPYRTDSDETIVRPFTIPAADIPRKALNMMLSHLTDVQQNYLDRAYHEVDQSDDWSLHDLANTVLETDAQDGVKRRIYNTLATLQNLGFIRTHDCEYAIDWEGIFRDAGTITVFTQSLVEDGAHKFMVLSYLIQALYHDRQDYYNLPPLTAVFRELHHIAPNDRTARQDEREREIQRGMVAAFQELCSMHRHEGIEVLADTQQLMGQINKRVREHVERVVTFRSQMGTLKPLFKDMVGLDGERHNYMTTIARDFDVGQAAVIGYTGTNRSLEMPLEVAPPMSHHLDATSPHGDGWQARVEILSEHDDLPDEELRPAPWDASIPSDLEFDSLSLSEDDPVEAFANNCLSECDDDSVGVGTVYDALEAFLKKNGHDDAPPKNVFGRLLGNELDFDREQIQKNGDREVVYHGLRFTATGEQYRQGA